MSNDRRGPAGSALEAVLAYHERTKHRPSRYARSLGYMDWERQPDPFRRYEGSALSLLDEVPPGGEPAYDRVFQRGGVEPGTLDRASVSQLFYDSLALSAWKELGRARWSLRVNPSSGALYPTEAYLLAGAVAGLSERPALYHYSPLRHGLELRRPMTDDAWSALAGDLSRNSVLVGLTEIHWRESWKYGERAFRYCNHDAGHAVAAVAIAASALGWETRLLEGWSDYELAVLLGVADQRGPEAEHPDCLLRVGPTSPADDPATSPARRPDGKLLARLAAAPPAGRPNRLGPDHHPWPVIDEVAAASERREAPGTTRWEPDEAAPAPTPRRALSARRIIRRRRSAVAMDGRTAIDHDSFHRMLGRLLPRSGAVPFATLPWKPAIHLVFFVHRVEGLDPGLYVLPREAGARVALQAAMRSEFAWTRPPGCPAELPFHLLARGDLRDDARAVSCLQEIASDGAFAVAMIAEFEPRLREHGAWFYRRLHWEAGAIGQVLYLEAEAAGLRGTGIGCFFDDELHDLVGLTGDRYQDLYHFTVGGPLEDARLKTLPAYDAERRGET